MKKLCVCVHVMYVCVYKHIIRGTMELWLLFSLWGIYSTYTGMPLFPTSNLCSPYFCGAVSNVFARKHNWEIISLSSGCSSARKLLHLDKCHIPISTLWILTPIRCIVGVQWDMDAFGRCSRNERNPIVLTSRTFLVYVFTDEPLKEDAVLFQFVLIAQLTGVLFWDKTK